MTDPHRPSRATAEGQGIAFVEGLARLTGRRRRTARVVVAGALALGAGGLVVAAVKAFSVAFG